MNLDTDSHDEIVVRWQVAHILMLFTGIACLLSILMWAFFGFMFSGSFTTIMIGSAVFFAVATYQTLYWGFKHAEWHDEHEPQEDNE